MELKEKYLKVEKIIKDNKDFSKGNFSIPEKILNLVSLYTREYSDSILIPNAYYLELLVCVSKATCYNVDKNLKGIISETFEGYNLLCENFLESEIKEKYDCILLFPPFGKYSKDENYENLYLKKSLQLLNPNGRLISILPQTILSNERNKSLREFIISSYSIDSVISLNITKNIFNANNLFSSLTIIENKEQCENIFMIDDFDSLQFDGILDIRKSGFGYFINSNEVYNRLDSEYYTPEYKKIRTVIQNKNTDTLDQHAIIFRGAQIPAEERKDIGDLLIIKPQYIYNNQIHYGNNKKYFCTKEFIQTLPDYEKYFLKNGDIVISTTGKTNWAIYNGPDNTYIANLNVAIIRPKSEDSKELISKFFTTKVGIEYFESQLNFFTHCGVYSNAFTNGELSLQNISIPNLSTFRSVKTLSASTEREIISNLAIQFQNCGWDVKEEYVYGNYRFDIVLFYNGSIHGIVEVKRYKSEDFSGNVRIIEQLKRYKSLINTNFYIFVDDGLYEFANRKFVRLSELPRPETCNEQIDSEHFVTEDVLIKKAVEETSLSDSFKLELILKKLNEMGIKIDSIYENTKQILSIVSNIQPLVEKQLKLAEDSPVEMEHILHAFSEECAEKTITKLKNQVSETVYIEEENKLKQLFESSWAKLDDRSKSFLISAKVMYREVSSHEEIIDYSGVCLLVTKALELELCNRFCENFLIYLKVKYGKKNYGQYPTILIGRYGKPITSSHFTLGSIAHLFCYIPDTMTEETYCSSMEISKAQFENNKSKIIEFCKNEYFIDKNDEEIFSLLLDYAEEIETVKNEYRNKAAHTNELKKIDAERCFKIVIDIEKLLKRMLDSFAK